MFRQITIGLLLLISCSVLAQEGTTSPYSYYGIGTLKFRGTVENRAMGGLGIFADSIHLNLQNPAAYSDLKLTTFAAAVSYQRSAQKSQENSHSASTTTLDYFGLGIPMGKFGMGFGLLPYSSVGYDFYTELSDGVTEYSGEGGLNRTYLSLAYQVTPKLSIGIDGHYNFGKIENQTVSQKSILQYGTRTIDNSKLGGFTFNIGALYRTMITQKLELTGSATYTPETSLSSKNERKIASVEVTQTGIRTIDERVIEVADTDFSFPSQVTLGAAISKPQQWGMGIEYTNQQWNKINSKITDSERATYKNASTFRLGGYYIPEYNSFTNYYKRVVYRAGMRYEQTGLSLDGQDINEFGISFGLGMPVGRLFSNINLGLEVGRRGTKSNGLIQENFFNASLSFSLNDLWFEKRLYN